MLRCDIVESCNEYNAMYSLNALVILINSNANKYKYYKIKLCDRAQNMVL